MLEKCYVPAQSSQTNGCLTHLAAGHNFLKPLHSGSAGYFAQKPPTPGPFPSSPGGCFYTSVVFGKSAFKKTVRRLILRHSTN